MNTFEKQFIEGCMTNKVPQGIAQQYWDQFVVPFANYGFNKSHSVCYSFNSYITAYLKANYPDEFIVSLLNVEMRRQNYEKIEDFEKNFSRKMDIKFLPRGLNDCGLKYKIERKKDLSKGIKKTEIRPPLLCKSVGHNAAKSIMENAPYKDIRKLAEKTDFTYVTSEIIGGLIDAGFFKGNKGIAKKEEYVNQFSGVRNDLKVAMKKGVDSMDMFEKYFKK